MDLLNNRSFFLLYLCIFLCVSCAPEKVEYGPDIYVNDPGFKVVGYLPGGEFDNFDQIMDHVVFQLTFFAEFEQGFDVILDLLEGFGFLASGHAAFDLLGSLVQVALPHAEQVLEM